MLRSLSALTGKSRVPGLRKRLVRQDRWIGRASFSSSPSPPFRVGTHIENIGDHSIPYVLIETSFLTRSAMTGSWSPVVGKQSTCMQIMRSLEDTIRSNGGFPISLGMLDGSVGHYMDC